MDNINHEALSKEQTIYLITTNNSTSKHLLSFSFIIITMRLK